MILDIFKNTAHKLDIQTAVEMGELVPVRCIRIHTNIHRLFKLKEYKPGQLAVAPGAQKAAEAELYAKEYGWTLIDDSNRKDLFMDMIRQMDMSYSYKPVLIKAVMLYADEKGRIKLEDVVSYFKSYYEGRRSAGLPVEKKNSIFAKGGYTDKEAERNILVNPFKRFKDMQMLRHTKTLGIVQVDESVWKRLSKDERAEIEKICDEKLKTYYQRMNK